MKKLVLIALTTLFVSTAFAFDLTQADNYVITKSGTTIYCQDLSYGFLNYLVAETADGQTVKFKADEVAAYMKNGKLYEKMPVVESGQITGKTEFMEVLMMKNGMKVFRYDYYDRDGNQLTDVLIYREQEFIVAFDYQNKENLIQFFS